MKSLYVIVSYNYFNRQFGFNYFPIKAKQNVALQIFIRTNVVHCHKIRHLLQWYIIIFIWVAIWPRYLSQTFSHSCVEKDIATLAVLVHPRVFMFLKAGSKNTLSNRSNRFVICIRCNVLSYLFIFIRLIILSAH